jgi:hypothetical protein
MDTHTLPLDPQHSNRVFPDAESLTWEQLTELEPRLLTLYERARAIKDNRRKPSFCANRTWGEWGGLREQLSDLVGWAVKRWGGDPRLATSRAYDIAYRKVYDALPDCRNCVCWGFQDIIDERLGRRQARRARST